MAHFVYKAKKATGDTYAGQKDADDRYALYHMIRESGDELVSFQEKKSSKGLKMNISLGGLTGHIGADEKINFARNLGAMLEAGLALSRALSVLERQAHNVTLKKVLADLILEISKGSTFSSALGKHPKVFPPVLISMVDAGEQSGNLPESLKTVALQLETTHSLEKRVRGAMMYPAVIVSAMIIIAVMMFIFVIPTLLKTFTDMNATLPVTTQFVLDISNLVQNYGLFIFIGVVVVGGLLWAWSRKPQGKRIIQGIMLKIPVIGALIQEVNTARTARTLSSLISSGVDIVEAVTITSRVVQNVHFRSVLEKAANAIKKGDLMSKVFADYGKLYPVFFVEMMSVGEETGKTGEMLHGVAEYYEADVDQKTKDMSTIIEPALMVVIGAAVGFFAVSMIQPMYSLVNSV